MPHEQKHNKENQHEDSEGDEEAEEEEGHKKKKVKNTKVYVPSSVANILSDCFQPPNTANIKSANIPHNDNIKALHAKWICHKKPGCSSEHCFIKTAPTFPSAIASLIHGGQ